MTKKIYAKDHKYVWGIIKGLDGNFDGAFSEADIKSVLNWNNSMRRMISKDKLSLSSDSALRYRIQELDRFLKDTEE